MEQDIANKTIERYYSKFKILGIEPDFELQTYNFGSDNSYGIKCVKYNGDPNRKKIVIPHIVDLVDTDTFNGLLKQDYNINPKSYGKFYIDFNNTRIIRGNDNGIINNAIINVQMNSLELIIGSAFVDCNIDEIILDENVDVGISPFFNCKINSLVLDGAGYIHVYSVSKLTIKPNYKGIINIYNNGSIDEINTDLDTLIKLVIRMISTDEIYSHTTLVGLLGVYDNKKHLSNSELDYIYDKLHEVSEDKANKVMEYLKSYNRIDRI